MEIRGLQHISIEIICRILIACQDPVTVSVPVPVPVAQASGLPTLVIQRESNIDRTNYFHWLAT